jgi:methionyl-tRNA synthetase
VTGQVRIIAPPPTPNGDLHVGHLSGPYLGADLYARHLAQHGVPSDVVISADDHQSYVDTTATRLGLDRDELVKRSREEITETLAMYAIGVDELGAIDDRYCRFVRGFFERLCAQGLIEVRPTEVLFDRSTGTHPVEGFVSGTCPTCFAPCAGGICEACGHPNSCVDLLDLDERYEVRVEPRLVLDLEDFRSQIEDTLSRAPVRPNLARLVGDLLSAPLAPFVLSYRSTCGIDTAFAGLPDQQLNVWGEMYPGHIHFLEEAGGPLGADDPYVQFLGYDNSYFYAFVHVALHAAARCAGEAWPAPSALVTNQFYNLDLAKFSTSKGHVVWARDLAQRCNTDLIRLYLALHGPEYQEASFVPASFDVAVEDLARRVNRTVAACNATVDGALTEPSPFPDRLREALATPTRLSTFSATALARTAVNAVDWLGSRVEAGDRGLRAHVPATLALALDVFCPAYAEAVRDASGVVARRWDELAPVARLRPLPEISVSP